MININGPAKMRPYRNIIFSEDGIADAIDKLNRDLAAARDGISTNFFINSRKIKT